MAILLAFSGVAVAQSSPVGVAVDDCDGILGTIECGVNYLWGEISAAAGGVFSDDGDSETDAAQSIKEDFNDHTDDWVTWANDNLNITDHADYSAVKIRIRGDTDETIYLHTDASDGEFTSAEIVGDSNRTVDWEVTVTGPAARDAPGVFNTVYAEYVSENEPISGSYAARIAGEYKDNVTVEEK